MCARALPGGNEVLGQVDADRCSCDRDMAVARPVQLAADLYLRSRHLPDLVDLSALAADDRADQLRGRMRQTGLEIFQLMFSLSSTFVLTGEHTEVENLKPR